MTEKIHVLFVADQSGRGPPAPQNLADLRASLLLAKRLGARAVLWHFGLNVEHLRHFLAANACAVCLLLCCFCAQASDWPQFLGPTRNGVYDGKIAESWGKEGPAIVWRRGVGQGFAGPVVSGGKLILFHRIENKEVVECLNATNGTALWTNGYPTAYRDDFGFDEGPRGTPAISDNRVYTSGAEGLLSCFDLGTGRSIWSVNTKRDFQAAKGFFGAACSPLIEGDAVLMIIGGKDGAGIVAFNKETGKVLWKGTGDAASYSSPTVATFGGRRTALFLTRSELAGADPKTGDVFFRFPFEPPIHSSVSAATPIVVDDCIFLTASYNAGAVLLKVNPNKWLVQKVWAGEDILSSHYATSVYRDGFLYGLDGRTDPGLETPTLRCVEFKTGKVRWKKDLAAATIILADNELLILTEPGELIRAPASPDGFKPTARAQIVSSQVRAHSALAEGKLYARSKNMLVCVDLDAKSPR
jgi:outer membrane protein assembly factor BamB